VPAARHDHHFEVLVGGEQRVGDLHRRGGIDVAVEFADGQQQLAAQLGGVRDVGGAPASTALRPAVDHIGPSSAALNADAG
jgi:hypothetical protein